jgi:hypothetical protein
MYGGNDIVRDYLLRGGRQDFFKTFRAAQEREARKTRESAEVVVTSAIDKRTGKLRYYEELADAEPFHTLTLDWDKGTIELISGKRKVHFDIKRD